MHLRLTIGLRTTFAALSVIVACGDDADAGMVDAALTDEGPAASDAPAADAADDVRAADATLTDVAGDAPLADAALPDAGPGLCNPDPARLRALTGHRPTVEPATMGTPHRVTTVAEFRALVDPAPGMASPLSRGDTILFAQGRYDLSGVIMRTPASGVLIKPEEGQYMAEFVNSGRSMISAAEDVVWWGFLVTGPGAFVSLQGDGGPTRADRNEFYGFRFDGAGATNAGNIVMFDVRTNDVEIHDNEFLACGARLWNGTVVQPPGTSPTPERMHVHHNSVIGIMEGSTQKLMGMGGGVWEDWNAPHDGWSTQATIEYNYVDGWLGNAELGGFKASDNTFQYNYFTNSGATGGRYNVRQGHRNVFFGNYIDGVKNGFAVQGDDNVFAYNYVLGDGAATGAFFATDAGDENLAMGRNDSARRTRVTCNIFSGGFSFTYCPVSGKTPINELPTDNVMRDNWWIGRAPRYTDCGHAITQVEMEAVNDFSSVADHIHDAIDACPEQRYTCEGLDAPSWW